MMIPYEGPLLYPPVGKIAVMRTGRRIEIWPNESDSADCFTGLMLLANRTREQIVVHDLSCMWDRSQIDHIEEPGIDDLRLGMLDRSMTSPIDLTPAQDGERTTRTDEV